MNYTYVHMLRTMSIDLTILYMYICTYVHISTRTCIHGVCTCIGGGSKNNWWGQKRRASITKLDFGFVCKW